MTERKTNSMKKITTYEIAVCGIMAALMCILGPMSVQIGPVPISLTNLVLYFSVYVLETRGTSISYIIYLLLGTCGLPVFSGYQGGPGKLMGPTGGYLFGFILMVLICGLSMELSKGNIFITFAGMVIGTAIAYLFGTLWFVKQLDCSVSYALKVCVYPFIGFDLGKIVIAIILGSAVRRALIKANLFGKGDRDECKATG